MSRRYREISNQVYELDVSDKEICTLVTDEDFQWLKAQSLRVNSRVRLCLHGGLDEALHQMVIALPKGDYVRPHCHHGKVESMMALEGQADLIFFDREGAKSQRLSLRANQSSLVRIYPGAFHTLQVLSAMFLFLETTTGPFRREDTEYAVWEEKEQR